MDRRYLTMIADIYRGGPVGVETLAAGLSEPRDTIEDVIEPYLLQAGLIARTARGRMLNASAWKHLGLNPPAGSQEGLFDNGKELYHCIRRDTDRTPQQTHFRPFHSTHRHRSNRQR